PAGRRASSSCWTEAFTLPSASSSSTALNVPCAIPCPSNVNRVGRDNSKGRASQKPRRLRNRGAEANIDDNKNPREDKRWARVSAQRPLPRYSPPALSAWRVHL